MGIHIAGFVGFLLSLALVAPIRAQAAASDQNAPLSFSGIRSCLPFTLLISPPGDPASNDTLPSGSIVLDADESVVNATLVTIEDDVLVLSIDGDFTTNRIISLTVTTPNASSLEFVQNSGAGDIVLSPGFNPTDLYLAVTSIGDIYAYGISTQHLRVVASGTNGIFVSGSYPDAEVVASGTSKVSLSGLNPDSGSANVTATGITTVWIEGGPGTQISGTADSLAKIQYTDGVCSVTPQEPLGLFGFSIFGPPCQAVGKDSAPLYNPPAFDCGMKVTGQSICSTAGAATVSVVPLLVPGQPVNETVPVTEPLPTGNVTGSNETLAPGNATGAGTNETLPPSTPPSTPSTNETLPPSIPPSTPSTNETLPPSTPPSTPSIPTGAGTNETLPPGNATASPEQPPAPDTGAPAPNVTGAEGPSDGTFTSTSSSGGGFSSSSASTSGGGSSSSFSSPEGQATSGNALSVVSIACEDTPPVPFVFG